jgi:hypothetical protein
LQVAPLLLPVLLDIAVGLPLTAVPLCSSLRTRTSSCATSSVSLSGRGSGSGSSFSLGRFLCRRLLSLELESLFGLWDRRCCEASTDGRQGWISDDMRMSASRLHGHLLEERGAGSEDEPLFFFLAMEKGGHREDQQKCKEGGPEDDDRYT